MKIISYSIVNCGLFLDQKEIKKSKENIENIDNMIMCNKCGFHVTESNLCVSKEQINQCPNKK